MRLLMAILLSTAILSGCHESTQVQDSTISVTGVANAQAVPNQFVVQAAAVAADQAVANASLAANAQVDKVFALTDRLGIARKQLQALSLQLTPQWDWNDGKRSFRGYEARRAISITLNSLDHYSELLQGLVDAGIGEIGATDARVANNDALQLELMAAAVQDARTKADVLAKAAGREVKQAISIQPVGSGAPILARKLLMAAPAESATFEPGETRLHQEVNVTFSLD